MSARDLQVNIEASASLSFMLLPLINSYNGQLCRYRDDVTLLGLLHTYKGINIH